MSKENLWEKCVEFHGHECGGLTIGYKAALLAIEILDLKFSEDENVVCISENDACGVDAVQVVLGCSAGKGNLLFHMRGKQAFSFYERNSGKSVRLVKNPSSAGMSREESFRSMQDSEPAALFDVKETKIILPERGGLFQSHTCDVCGEQTVENWVRLQGEQKLCLDCYIDYDRFKV